MTSIQDIPKPGVATVQTIKDELLTLPEARRPQAERIASTCSIPQIRGYFKALRGELSPKKAICMMCLHCVGWERAEAEGCTAKGCPLWAYRPGSSEHRAPSDHAEAEEA